MLLIICGLISIHKRKGEVVVVVWVVVGIVSESTDLPNYPISAQQFWMLTRTEGKQNNPQQENNNTPEAITAVGSFQKNSPIPDKELDRTLLSWRFEEHLLCTFCAFLSMLKLKAMMQFTAYQVKTILTAVLWIITDTVVNLADLASIILMGSG